MKSSGLSHGNRWILSLAGCVLAAVFIVQTAWAKPPWTNPMTPPAGTLVAALPQGCTQAFKNGVIIYLHQGVFFRRANQGYVVMIPPVGLVTPGPPEGFVTLRVADQTIYYYNDVYYRPVAGGFMVVQAPPPEAVVSATPWQQPPPPDAQNPAAAPPETQSPPPVANQMEPAPEPSQIQEQPADTAQIKPVQPPPPPTPPTFQARAPEKERVRITAVSLPVHSSPNPMLPVIGQVEKDQVVEVYGKWEDWLWIRLFPDLYGWIPARFTRPEKNQG